MQRVDRIRLLYENLIKIVTLYIHPGSSTSYAPAPPTHGWGVDPVSPRGPPHAVTDLKIQVAEAVSSAADVLQNVGQTNEAAIVDRLRAVNLGTQTAEQNLGVQFLKDGSLLPEDSALGASPCILALLLWGNRADKRLRKRHGGRSGGQRPPS